MLAVLRATSAFAFCVHGASARVGQEKCPEPTEGWASKNGGVAVDIKFTNHAPVTALVDWYNSNGQTDPEWTHTIAPNEEKFIHSFSGHVFRVHGATEGRPLMMEYVAKEEEGVVTINGCGGIKAVKEGPLVSPRAAEFESLVHDQSAPCEPAGKSSKWSCIRYTSKEDYGKRSSDGSEYGFADQKEAGTRAVGDVWDFGYVSHKDKIPRLADGRGYLKMSFTKKMREVLMPFIAEYGINGSKSAVQVHPAIPGGYTNSHVVSLSKIDLDDFRHIQKAVASEMQQIEEWWTKRRLVHAATFGVRIYHRDSMLINHIDRADTHLASAVIQVAQLVDEDGGWPLEVIDAEGNCGEVFLQPGEFVLYEGGRFRHGRPMRLKGEHMSNIFSHFTPLDWHGPDKSPAYDGLLDKDGYLHSKPGEEEEEKEL